MFVSESLQISYAFGASSHHSADLMKSTVTIMKMNANSVNWFRGLVNLSGRGMVLASLLSTLGIGVLLPLQRACVPLQIASSTWGSPTLTVKSNPTPSLGAYQTSYSALYLFLSVMVCAAMAGSTGTLYFARSTSSSAAIPPSGTGDISNHHPSETGSRRRNIPSSWPPPPQRPPADRDLSVTNDRIRKGPSKRSDRQKTASGDEPPPPPGSGTDDLLVNPDEPRDFIFGMLVLGALCGRLLKMLKRVLTFTKRLLFAKQELEEVSPSTKTGQSHSSTTSNIEEPLLPTPSRVWPGGTSGILDSSALLTCLTCVLFLAFSVFFRFKTRLRRGHPIQIDQYKTAVSSDLPVISIDRRENTTPQSRIYRFEGNPSTPSWTYRTALLPASNQRTVTTSNGITPSRGVLTSSQSFTAGTPEKAPSRKWDRVRVSNVEQVKYFYQDEIIGFGNGPPRRTRPRRANSVS